MNPPSVGLQVGFQSTSTSAMSVTINAAEPLTQEQREEYIQLRMLNLRKGNIPAVEGIIMFCPNPPDGEEQWTVVSMSQVLKLPDVSIEPSQKWSRNRRKDLKTVTFKNPRNYEYHCKIAVFCRIEKGRFSYCLIFFLFMVKNAKRNNCPSVINFFTKKFQVAAWTSPA